MRKKILAALLVTLACGMITGCGDSSSSTPATADQPTAVKVAPAPPGSPTGSVATAEAVTAKTTSGTAVTTIPKDVVISPISGSLPTSGSINLVVKTPTNAEKTSGMTAPAGRVLVATAGAVDISIENLSSGFTVSQGLDVTVPVGTCPSSLTVYVVHADRTITDMSSSSSCASGVTTVRGITKFSSVLVNPTFATGS